jgi:hypothetical protein
VSPVRIVEVLDVVGHGQTQLFSVAIVLRRPKPPDAVRDADFRDAGDSMLAVAESLEYLDSRLSIGLTDVT